MFDFFKNKKDNKDLDAKGLRELILSFVKEELQRLDGGEGKDIAALQLYINPDQESRFLYETAVYFLEPEILKNEIQRIADNYALALPLNWTLEVLFVAEQPAGAILGNGITAGIIFKRAVKGTVNKTTAVEAQVNILKGYAEQASYVLNAGTARINIGREKNIQADDGSFRINTIAFPENAAYESNKYISRQHAHIEWDENAAQFKLYADEGGVPPGNKTKIRWAGDESVQKLNSTHIGYPLSNGDQVILGDVAVLEFIFI